MACLNIGVTSAVEYQYWVGTYISILDVAHSSYLDIYISRKIRLCVVDLEGKFQTNLQAKLLNFLVWKFRSIILNFLLFFAGFVKSSAFCTLSLLFQRIEIFELWPKGWGVWPVGWFEICLPNQLHSLIFREM